MSSRNDSIQTCHLTSTPPLIAVSMKVSCLISVYGHLNQGSLGVHHNMNYLEPVSE